MQLRNRLRSTVVDDAEVTVAASLVAAALITSVYGPLPLPVKLEIVAPPAKLVPVSVMPFATGPPLESVQLVMRERSYTELKTLVRSAEELVAA